MARERVTILKTRKHIVISGYYGFGNIGDEAVLAGILAALRQVEIDANITVMSGNPEDTRAAHPDIEVIHRYKIIQVIKAIKHADLVISGGGSLLQDVTSAKSLHYYLFILRLAHLFKRKTMIYAQGLGPLIRKSSQKSVASVLSRVSAITVRDEDSLALLKSIGVQRPITVVSDPAFLVEPDFGAADELLAKNCLKSNKLIGISLRPWQGMNKWLPEAAEGIRRAVKEFEADAIVIPMQESEDTSICESAGIGKVIQANGCVNLAKGLVAKCEMIVGMRLHALIFAASAGVPFVPIVYDPKVSSFAAMAGQTNGVHIDSLRSDDIYNAIVNTWTNRNSIKEELEAKAIDIKEQALIPAKIAFSLINE